MVTSSGWLQGIRQIFLSNWKLILACALTAAIGMGTTLGLSGRQFQASVVVVVQPVQSISDLRQEPINVQSFQQLLESDDVLASLMARLREAGVVSGEDDLIMGEDLLSEIFVSKRNEAQVVAPVIRATARASSGKTAAIIANQWVNVFLEQMRSLRVRKLDLTVGLVEEHFVNAEQEWQELTEQRTQLLNTYDERTDAAVNRWERRVADARRIWDKKIAALEAVNQKELELFNAETRRLMTQLVENAGLRASSEAQASGLPEDSSAALSTVEELALDLLEVRVQIAQTSEFLVLEKGVSDESLWEVMALSQGEKSDLQPFSSRFLQSQEVNPVYLDLVRKLTSLENRGDLARKEHAWLSRLSAQLESLQKKREIGLAELVSGQSLAIKQLQSSGWLAVQEAIRAKATEVATLARERDLALEHLKGRIEQAESLIDRLSSTHAQANLAHAEARILDVEIGSSAHTSLKPESRGFVIRSAAAAILGGLVGLLAGALRKVANEEGEPPIVPRAEQKF